VGTQQDQAQAWRSVHTVSQVLQVSVDDVGGTFVDGGEEFGETMPWFTKEGFYQGRDAPQDHYRLPRLEGFLNIVVRSVEPVFIDRFLQSLNDELSFEISKKSSSHTYI
jgi:hypothetical protein